MKNPSAMWPESEFAKHRGPVGKLARFPNRLWLNLFGKKKASLPLRQGYGKRLSLRTLHQEDLLISLLLV
jgi:hypothetical protein